MSVKTMLGTMVAGTALIIVAGARGTEPQAKPAQARPTERPWLSKEAAAQIIAPGGGLGPLFAGVELGGPAPAAEIRDRIAAFARRNDVAIELDVEAGVLAAIRFDVTYAGGTGYEGADVLALRFARPTSGGCCGCGQETWINDWTIASDTSWAHVRVDVNRVAVTWQPTLTTAQLIARADGLLGMDERELTADKGWVNHVGGTYTLVAPYPFATGYPRRYGDVGIAVDVERGRVAEIRFDVWTSTADTRELVETSLRDRFGRARVTATERTWRRPDRVITTDLDYQSIKIRRRAS